jgi:predicted amidohydrolase
MNNIRFKLAMGQMLVEGGCRDENLRRAVRMVEDAAAQGCRIVVLPECLDAGWAHPEARRLAEPIPGRHSDLLAGAARQAGIYVAAGLTERDGERIYNSAVVVSPEGEILVKHRKINELEIAHDLYATGDRLSVAETALGRIGLTICADNFSSSLALGHSLGRMGARLLVSPSAWAVEADHDNLKDPYGETWTVPYTTLARLYDMTVVGVSNVGRINGGAWRGRKCIGCSLTVGPGGEILARGPYGESAEALVVVPVELQPCATKGTQVAEMLAAKGYVGP